MPGLHGPAEDEDVEYGLAGLSGAAWGCVAYGSDKGLAGASIGRKEDHSGTGLAGEAFEPMAEWGDKGGCGRLVMMAQYSDGQ